MYPKKNSRTFVMVCSTAVLRHGRLPCGYHDELVLVANVPLMIWRQPPSVLAHEQSDLVYSVACHRISKIVVIDIEHVQG